MINFKFQSVSSQRRKPKRVIKNIINTITLIAIRNTPQTIPLVMYQRILIIRRKQCSRNVNTASPMDCAVCLMFIAAVICICQVQQFCRTISYGVPSCLLPCILFIVHTSLQGMFVVCHINQIAILVMVSHF